MTRKLARVDANHREIVKALRKAGASVQSLASVGGGCPDLLVSHAGRVCVMEVKMGDGRLTPDQQTWLANWRAPLYVVRSAETALDVLKQLGR